MTQLKEADPRIRGILGDNYLEHFDILIDNRLHLLCLDDSRALALAIRGEHVALVEPRGTQDDLLFTRPMIVSARLSAATAAPMLLRLDSGSNALVLYETCPQIHNMSRTSLLRRVVNGVDQAFAVFAAQDLEVGTKVCSPSAVCRADEFTGRRAAAPGRRDTPNHGISAGIH